MLVLQTDTAPTGRRLRLLVGILASSALLAGCFTGERPSFKNEDAVPAEATGNADIEMVAIRQLHTSCWRHRQEANLTQNLR